MLRSVTRVFRNSPVQAWVAVSSLALGVGVNVTIYSVVRELILDDLSARRPDRLAAFGGVTNIAVYRDLRRAGIFQDLAFTIGLSNADWDAGGHKEIVGR